jgi:hypothetical protein
LMGVPATTATSRSRPNDAEPQRNVGVAVSVRVARYRRMPLRAFASPVAITFVKLAAADGLAVTSHAGCKDNLVCRPDVGAAVGLSPDKDICDLPGVPGWKAINRDKQGNRISEDSGWCTPESPCALGEGDCDENDHSTCRGYLKCKANVGNQFGFSNNAVERLRAPGLLLNPSYRAHRLECNSGGRPRIRPASGASTRAIRLRRRAWLARGASDVPVTVRVFGRLTRRRRSHRTPSGHSQERSDPEQRRCPRG